jgi:hypothetical protein
VIFDSHMHIGSMGPQFGVSIDAAGIAELMREHLSGLAPDLVERILSTNARALFLGALV